MKRQLIIAVGVAIVLIAVLFFALLKPKSGQISSVNAQIATEVQHNNDLRNTKRQLEAARAQAPATQAKLAKFDALLPSTPDLPTFIREVQAAANKEGVNLQSIAPSPPTPLQNGTSTRGGLTGVNTISVNLNVTAGFFRLESFLSRLEDLSRVVEVRNLSITPTVDTATGLSSLQSTITLTMYEVTPGASTSATTTASPTPSTSPGA